MPLISLTCTVGQFTERQKAGEMQEHCKPPITRASFRSKPQCHRNTFIEYYCCVNECKHKQMLGFSFCIALIAIRSCI